MHGNTGVTRLADVYLERRTDHLRDQPLVAAAEIRSGRDVHPRSHGPQPRHGARSEELLGDRAVRDGGTGLRHPLEFDILTVHRVRHDAAASEHARPADSRAGQELAVVGIQVGVDLIGILGFVHLAGTRAVVLVEVAVKVDAPIAYRIVKITKAFQGVRGDREGEPRNDGDVQARGVHVTGVGGVPLVDLLAGQPDGVFLRGDQSRGGRGSDRSGCRVR